MHQFRTFQLLPDAKFNIKQLAVQQLSPINSLNANIKCHMCLHSPCSPGNGCFVD
uniref:Uncharacterized protein n=1 Tax=Anguilla anguilla TaxID=7936 RepID=A0A0E9XGS1_ANGAN